MTQLHIIQGPMKGQSFELKDEKTSIGRGSENQVQIKDPSVSRRHAQIIKKGDAFYIEDLKSQNGTWIDGNLKRPGFRFEIKEGVPIIIGNTLLSLGEKCSADLFSTHYSIDLLEYLPDSGKNLLYEDGRITDKEKLELINEVSETLMQSLDINEIFEKVMAALFYCLKRIDGGAIFMIDRQTGEWREALVKLGEGGESGSLDYSRTIVNLVIHEGKALMMTDTKSADTDLVSESITKIGIKSLMCAPLIRKNEVIGAIYAQSLDLSNRLTKEDLFLMTGLCGPVSLAIENASLYSKTRKAEEALRQAHKELEKRVEQRTLELAKTNEELRKRTYDLDLRVRQMYCLYAISSMQGNPRFSIEKILQNMANRIPLAWQYPEITCVRITLGRRVIATRNIQDTPWKLAQDIVVNGLPAGKIEVCYLEKKRDADEGPFVKEERTLLNVIAERVGETVARKQAEEALVQARKKELEIGARIQQALLLGKLPTDISGIKIAPMTIPSKVIDGDFYDFFRHNEHCIDLLLGDVMGKGVPAALVGAGVKSQFLRSLTQIFSSSRTLPTPKEIIEQVHQQMVKELINLESFVTLCYARFDLKLQKMDFIDCGHPKTIHFHRLSNTCSTIEGHNVPLGFREDEEYVQVAVPLAAGDVLFFYSDGVTEAQNTAGEFFGESRLMECIQHHGRSEPAELTSEVLRSVSSFCGSEILVDDVTCVAVRIENGAGLKAFNHAVLDITGDLGNIEKVRAFIRDFCLKEVPPPVDKTSLWQLELAVTEATANVMKHAYDGVCDRRILLTADRYDDHITIRLDHWGKSFEPPSSIQAPAVDQYPESGFGLFLIDSYMDDVVYSRDEKGMNSICLIKNLKPA